MENLVFSLLYIELWFFGWSPEHYRRNFVFAPLPALVSIPHIMHSIHQVEHTLDTTHTVIADVRPQHEVLLIKQYKPEISAHVLPFATQEQIKQMSNLADLAKPENYSDLIYNRYIQTSFEKAICHFLVNPVVKGLQHHPSKQIRHRMRMRINRKTVCK